MEGSKQLRKLFIRTSRVGLNTSLVWPISMGQLLDFKLDLRESAILF